MDSRSIVFLIVLNLGISFAVAGIAWQAHVGGLITGGLLTAAYAYAPRNQRTLVQVGATVAVVAVLVIALSLDCRNPPKLLGLVGPRRYRHFVDSATPAMMRTNPMARFHAASASMGRVPPVM